MNSTVLIKNYISFCNHLITVLVLWAKVFATKQMKKFMLWKDKVLKTRLIIRATTTLEGPSRHISRIIILLLKFPIKIIITTWLFHWGTIASFSEIKSDTTTRCKYYYDVIMLGFSSEHNQYINLVENLERNSIIISFYCLILEKGLFAKVAQQMTLYFLCLSFFQKRRFRDEVSSFKLINTTTTNKFSFFH